MPNRLLPILLVFERNLLPSLVIPRPDIRICATAARLIGRVRGLAVLGERNDANADGGKDGIRSDVDGAAARGAIAAPPQHDAPRQAQAHIARAAAAAPPR